MVKYIIPVQ
uniref:Uncharacterized protein n=1 Tax=Anguilla anguilla TaxID=7936 RepID=A0A0E9SLW9_ANGAN